MSDLTLGAERGVYAIPDELVLNMIEDCAMRIAKAQTIPAVKRVITEAEAIAAFMRKAQASERMRRNAELLRIDAERQLGTITKQIPLGARGAAAQPGQQTKRKTLADHGINKFRAQIAEKLADTPKAVIDEAIASSKSPTLSNVVLNLGLRKRARFRNVKLDTLAEDAIALLDECCTTGRAPTRAEVDGLRQRLATQRVA